MVPMTFFRFVFPNPSPKSARFFRNFKTLSCNILVSCALWRALVRRRWSPFPDRPNGSTSLLSQAKHSFCVSVPLGELCRARVSSSPIEEPSFRLLATSPSDIILGKPAERLSEIFYLWTRGAKGFRGSVFCQRRRWRRGLSHGKNEKRSATEKVEGRPNMKSKRKKRVLGDVFKDPRT